MANHCLLMSSFWFIAKVLGWLLLILFALLAALAVRDVLLRQRDDREAAREFKRRQNGEGEK